MKHEPEHEQYIGKPLSECPDGTMAVATDEDGLYLVLVKSQDEAHDDGDGSPTFYGDPADFTVTHILTLGTPRPKTLADEEAGVVWMDQYGAACLHDGCNQLYMDCGLKYFVRQSGSLPGEKVITKDWTRLGPITGIEIDGEVWRGDK